MLDLDKKYFFQLVKQIDGTRSEPVVFSFRDLSQYLVDNEPEDQAYVLVIGSAIPEEDSQDFISGFPLISTEAFIAYVDRAKEAA